MKLIFAVLSVSRTMGLTRRYKMEGFFYRAASMQGGLTTSEMSVYPSVRPSDKRVNCDKPNEFHLRFYTM